MYVAFPATRLSTKFGQKNKVVLDIPQREVELEEAVEQDEHGFHAVVRIYSRSHYVRWNDSGDPDLSKKYKLCIVIERGHTPEDIADGKYEIISVQRDDIWGTVENSEVREKLWNASTLINYKENCGLRSPQLAALYSIQSHRYYGVEPGIVVMPTGTGKTETMLAALLKMPRGKLLVMVPSSALRIQIADKFAVLGVLRVLGLVDLQIPNPAVAYWLAGFKTDEEGRKFIEAADVIVTTPTLLDGATKPIRGFISSEVSYLFIDEAHHSAANTWAQAETLFDGRNVYKFTATPFRMDGKRLVGKHIFNYPLSRAQEDNYFDEIEYHPVEEFRADRGDFAVATMAVSLLNSDLGSGKDHLLMARCSSVTRAELVFEIYKELLDGLVTIAHSRLSQTKIKAAVKRLRNRECRAIVCVDMFGEGFDLPELKIGAMHDTRQSIPITLQLIGRFARTSNAPNIGTAKFVVNEGNSVVIDDLKSLYKSGADWNSIIPELSERIIGEIHKESSFSNAFVDRGPAFTSIGQIEVSCSGMAFKLISDANEPSLDLEAIDTLRGKKQFFTTRDGLSAIAVIKTESVPRWLSNSDLLERSFEVIVALYFPGTKVLFLHSSDTNRDLNKIAGHWLGSYTQINGEVIFRTFSGVQKLLLSNVGLRQINRDNAISFLSYYGRSVDSALTDMEKVRAEKNHCFGVGYRDGAKVSIGVSKRGRIWSYRRGSVLALREWAGEIISLLLDETIDIEQVLAGVLIPRILDQLPDVSIFAADYAPEVLPIISGLSAQWDERQAPLSYFRFVVAEQRSDTVALSMLLDDEVICNIKYALNNGDFLFAISDSINSISSKEQISSTQWLNAHPLSFLLVDGARIRGNRMISPQNLMDHFDTSKLVACDWDGVNIRHETMNKDDRVHDETVQGRFANRLLQSDECQILIDDDSSGEMADLVAVSEHTTQIRIDLYHAKSTSADSPGARLSDLQVVCTQALRSIVWKDADSEAIIRHILGREATRNDRGYDGFIKGDKEAFRALLNKAMRYKSLRISINIVQPGVSKASLSDNQRQLLIATASFIEPICGEPLKIYCSK